MSGASTPSRACPNGRPAWPISVYHPHLFKDCRGGAFPLAPLLRRAAEGGQVSGECFDGKWMDVGTPQRLAKLRTLLDGKAAPA